MMLSHEPDNWWNIVHALVIGHNYYGLVCWDIMPVFKGISCSQKMSATYQEPIQDINTLLVCLIAQGIVAKPLNRVKNQQRESKEYEV